MQEVYSESDWSDINACKPYMKSKLLAEKAAWDYLNLLPDKDRFELVVLNPTIILGPTLVGKISASG